MKNLAIYFGFTSLLVLGLSCIAYGFMKESGLATFIGGGSIGLWQSLLLDYIRSIKND